MAVRVMVAPAIANGDIGKPARTTSRGRDKPAAKPRRRRSSVFDADGNEVFITLVCLKCHKTRPLSQFGLRKMADGSIRNQPWCRSCRSVVKDGPRRARAENDPVAVAPSPPAHLEAAPEEPAPTRPAASVAAEVAAALAAGLRR